MSCDSRRLEYLRHLAATSIIDSEAVEDLERVYQASRQPPDNEVEIVAACAKTDGAL